jgi:Zn-dependent alcohol dehydrogenase
MTNGGVDCSVECTGNINAMIQAFECVHDVCSHYTYASCQLFLQQFEVLDGVLNAFFQSRAGVLLF